MLNDFVLASGRDHLDQCLEHCASHMPAPTSYSFMTICAFLSARAGGRWLSCHIEEQLTQGSSTASPHNDIAFTKTIKKHVKKT
jgi:hypothetical protein